MPARIGARLQAVCAHARPPTSGRVPARARLLRTGMLGLGLHGLAALWSRAGGGEVGEVEGVDDLRGAVRLLAAGAGPMETYAGAGARLGGHLKGVCVCYGSTGTADANRARVRGRADDATVPRAVMYFYSISCRRAQVRDSRPPRAHARPPRGACTMSHSATLTDTSGPVSLA